MDTREKPLISVVTVCYNAANDIERTMLSVLNQTYKQIEYIIIDGGSTDGTVDIIKKHADKLAYWVSEPDNGIYDAMNKGGIKASGDWLQFLNSGDVLADVFVFEKIFNDNKYQGFGVIYGDIWERRPSGLYLSTPKDLEDFSFDFPIAHPSTFVRTGLFKSHLFDVTYKLAADFELLRKLYYSHISFCYIPIAFVQFDAIEGVSAVSPVSCFKERTRILGADKGIIWKANRSIKLSRLRIKLLILKIIGLISPQTVAELRKKRLESNSHYTLISDKKDIDCKS